MIDLNIGGACPRRALTYALARALICPSGPLDAPLPKGGLGLVAVNGNLQDGIAMVADIAAKAGRTWLMANFADDHTNICSGIVQLRPTVLGVEVTTVHPFLLEDGAPMTLISSCAKRAFAFDAQGQITDVPQPVPLHASPGADRGWGELRRRMKASAKGASFWPWESWEIRVA